MNILYKDNHLLVIGKPAGLATAHGAIPGKSLFDFAKTYIKKKFNKPGNVYLGLVHRLDQAVSGVVVFARTSKAAARLSEQFRNSTVQKTYCAVTEGVPVPKTGIMQDSLLVEEGVKTVAITAKSPETKEAITHYEMVEEHGGLALVHLFPKTGRKHQLRVQMASRGWPILGDSKYGAKEKMALGIALHGLRIEIIHPVSKKKMSFEMPLPDNWRRIFPWMDKGNK